MKHLCLLMSLMWLVNILPLSVSLICVLPSVFLYFMLSVCLCFLGVRSYLKEALVSIISVHAEVRYIKHTHHTPDLPQSLCCCFYHFTSPPTAMNKLKGVILLVFTPKSAQHFSFCTFGRAKRHRVYQLFIINIFYLLIYNFIQFKFQIKY